MHPGFERGVYINGEGAVGVHNCNFFGQQNGETHKLAKPNMATMTIYSPDFYIKKTGSYLHAILQIYGIVKLVNKFLFFTFS